MDPGGTSSKLTSVNANFSSPQCSSPSSTADGGSSAFLAMAERLHQLRLAAASPRRNNGGSTAASKESVREELISMEPLAPNQNFPSAVNENEGSAMPQISIARADDRRSAGTAIMGRKLPSQTSSTAPSLSDVSITSFYRLPAAQVQTSDVIGFGTHVSSSSLGRSKVWSSEPVLASHKGATMGTADTANNDQFSLFDEDYDRRIGRRCAEKRQGNLSAQPASENPFSARFSELTNSLQHDDLRSSMTYNARVQDRPFAEPDSWHYATFSHESFPTAGVPDAYGINPSTAADDVRIASWSRAVAPKEPGTPPAASLPPLPLGLNGSRIGLLRPPVVSHAGEVPSSSSMKNSAATEQAFPDSISRLMNAVSSHPVGDLDCSKLKTILREQRKSYKRRLERERAKRKALEDLLVKLNTPRSQYRSFSNSSSTASTVRNASNQQNGRSSADLGDVLINSLRSSSVDGSSTVSEDAFLLELIQQHLRMKQALLGHLGKRTTASSTSGSGGEQDGRDHETICGKQAHDFKRTAHSPHGNDDDDIPMGGEAASGATGGRNLPISTSRRLLNGQGTENGDTYCAAGSKPPIALLKSKSVDGSGHDGGGGGNQLNGLIDKEALKLTLDNNSSRGGSEHSGRASSLERRRQRKRWETNWSGHSAETTERDNGGLSAKTASSGRRQRSATVTPRPSVAFFVPADAEKLEKAGSELTELKAIKPLQNVFCERQSKFIQRSRSRQDCIKAASELRSETARRIRELADNVAHGRMRMEDASEQLLLYELPQPSAFPRLEMFRASKLKYEQLPETVARRDKLKKESDLATNRVMAKIFKQKMAYKRLLKKVEKQGLVSTIPSSVVASSGPPSVRLFNR